MATGGNGIRFRRLEQHPGGFALTRFFSASTAATVGAFLSPSLAEAQGPVSSTVAVRDAEGRLVTTLTLSDAGNGLLVTGTLSGVSPGPHAIHFHAVGE